jgi:hypothetical protein
MKSSSALTAAKTVIQCLRWVAVLGLVYSLLGALVYSALGVPTPAPLAAVQNLVFMFLFHALRETAVVVAGAMIAPRARLTTAIVLAALLVPLSLWNHVLFRAPDRILVLVISDMLAHPWVINYRHFALETLGAVLGVVYIFWSEKAKGSVASVPPDPPPP